MIENLHTEQENSNRYNVRVLDRALSILTLLSDGKPRTAKEISDHLGLNTSTTFRLLKSLMSYQYVNQDEATNQYRLWLACLELAKGFNEGYDLRQIAIPELQALRNEIKETVHLAIVDRMQVVYIEKLQGLHAIGLMGSRVGGRSPVYCTGVGKALLAYMDQKLIEDYFATHEMKHFTETTITSLEGLTAEMVKIRQRGYALDKGEHEPEVRCVAAPIFNMFGKAIASISVSGPASRIDPVEDNRVMIDLTRDAAVNISKKMGYSLDSTITE